ncbi:MAG TPA: MlaD family protein [Rhizomicrobium sp.]
MSADDRTGGARTVAATRRSAWPGWIWAIPIAAVLVVGWLLFRNFVEGGTDITITFADAHGLREKGSNVEYRGVKIGSVTGIALNETGSGVVVSANIDGSASRYLTAGTLFWLNGAKPSISDLSSLGAVLSGPTIVMQPGPGAKTTRFSGLAYKPLFSRPQGAPVLYAVEFSGAVGALAPGDTVTLRGFTVGEVRQIGFHYDTQSGALATPVTLALYPQGFHLEDDAALTTAIAKLVGEGLRARLGQDPPLIGSWRVTLDVIPGAPTATLAGLGGLPEIPVAPGGGLDSILAKFNKVPVDQIAQNVLDITHHVDALVSSPKLEDSIAQLDASLRQVHETTADIGPKIAQLVQQLRSTADKIDQTAGQIEQTAKTADKTLGGAPSQNGISSTLQEVTDAARSLRELANYLDRHPEALIKGRSGG